MTFALALFAPDEEFAPPRTKLLRRATPPPPPDGAPKNSLKERICQRLLATDPILFMVGVLLIVCGVVIGLWDAMRQVLPL